MLFYPNAPVPRRLPRGRPASRPGAQRGSAVIEFALVFPILFALIVAIFELSRLFCIDLTLHSAAREAARFAVTGNVIPDPNAPGRMLPRVASIVANIQRMAPGLGVSHEHVTVIGPNGPGDPGGPGDLVTIRIDFDIPLVTPIVKPIFPQGVYRSSVSIIARNERFDP